MHTFFDGSRHLLPPSLPPYLPQVLVSLQEEHVLPPITTQHGQSSRALLGGEDEDGGGEGLNSDDALVRPISAWGGREGGRESSEWLYRNWVEMRKEGGRNVSYLARPTSNLSPCW